MASRRGESKTKMLGRKKEQKGAEEEKKPKISENDTVNHSQRPHYGLHNQGATSYLNSVLQVLFMTTEMHNRLDSSEIDRELRNIFENLKEKTCRTENVTQSLGIKDVYQQRDAADCLELILSKISKQASEVFQGQWTDTTKCSKGHIINEETNPFWTLSLSIKNLHGTIYIVKKGFERIFQRQSCDGTYKVACAKCKKETKAVTEREMVESPQILVLLLKRFGFDSNTMSNVKLDCQVKVPCVLQTENKEYKLYGIVNQVGSLRGGHYKATIMSYEDKTWYEFDDDQVKKVEEQPFAENQKSFISSNAYLLMYNGVESKAKMIHSTKPFIQQEKMKKKTKDNENTESGLMTSHHTNPYPQSPEGIAADEKKPKDKEDTVNHSQRPHYGLRNQGATCYLNSVLQVLFMTNEIQDRLDPKSQFIDRELRNIFEKLEERTCRTQNITQSLGIQDVYQQRDAADCLELILSKISKQASEVFQGQLADTTKCCKGHIINEETNPFWTLSLSMKDTHDTYSVEKGAERIFQTKSYSGGNMVHCVECNQKTEATSGCEMEKFPQILVLLLKRFEFDYNTMSHVKSDHKVEVPRALQMKNKKYKLYGMVNHMGSLRGGHYTATILTNEDKTWYEFDDAQVNKVEDQPFAKAGTYNSSTAYLLMYRASGSLRDKAKERQDKIEQLDQQRGDKEEHKGSRGTERRKDAPVHRGRGEEGDSKQKKVLSFRKDTIETDPQHPHNQRSTSHSSKQYSDSRAKAETRKQRSKYELGEMNNDAKLSDSDFCLTFPPDENSPQLCKNFKKNPLFIFLVAFGCVFIVILIVVLTTVNMI